MRIMMPRAIPIMRKAVRHPISGVLIMLSASLPSMSVDAPKPIISTPEQSPFLSGNHMLTVEITALYAMPIPRPPMSP